MDLPPLPQQPLVKKYNQKITSQMEKTSGNCNLHNNVLTTGYAKPHTQKLTGGFCKHVAFHPSLGERKSWLFQTNSV